MVAGRGEKLSTVSSYAAWNFSSDPRTGIGSGVSASIRIGLIASACVLQSCEPFVSVGVTDDALSVVHAVHAVRTAATASGATATQRYCRVLGLVR